MLEALQSDALRNVKHGYFTRKGGVSEGIYAGLNCGRGSNDAPDLVTENRARVAQHLGVPTEQLCGVHQYHSAEVVTLTEPTQETSKADGMVTNVAGIALGILTADCQPILFHDPDNHVIGATHAGWKGAIGGVIENTVDAMIALGAKRESICAAIGPCISQSAYEVGPEFFEDFMDQDPDHSRFFANGNGDRYLFNLAGFGLACLRETGIEKAEWTGHCTYADAERFYSYRRTTHKQEPDYGRLIAAIVL